MDISVRDLHNDMVNQSDNGGLDSVVDYVTKRVLISDTTLRLFILPHVIKTTPRLRQGFGCDICIIPKDMQIDSNRFRRIL